ncbi:hypothetical protein [Methylovulum miyakonense]|uniref:hypothetical protein n=1 Tax=Methylovulum miyakonense TaxID=645578 RepID=UPI00035CE293|nr:hypothetical protein [Methylovulum miyakonense]
MNTVYRFAKKFLISQIPSPNAKKILESYLTLPDGSAEPVEINELFRRLLSSAQNTNMKANVIGGSIDGIENLGKALFNFDPKKVDKKFANDPSKLLSHLIKKLNPRGEIRETSRSIWPKYCQTIISASVFFNQFEDGDDFFDWANYLYQDERSMASLPMILAAEIDGIGYPLACDFLKELGFVNFGKPDVHIIDIFVGIGLCDEKASPYKIQKIIAQMAKASKVSSYNIDKLFWLIGSGKLDIFPK